MAGTARWCAGTSLWVRIDPWFGVHVFIAVCDPISVECPAVDSFGPCAQAQGRGGHVHKNMGPRIRLQAKQWCQGQTHHCSSTRQNHNHHNNHTQSHTTTTTTQQQEARSLHPTLDLNHALSHVDGPTQSQLSRPMSSGHHISMEHRLRRKHQKLNSDTDARNETYLKAKKKKRRNTLQKWNTVKK